VVAEQGINSLAVFQEVQVVALKAHLAVVQEHQDKVTMVVQAELIHFM
jgi:hypothetical protein